MPHNTIRKWKLDDIEDAVMGLLSDGKPRTFNAIGVELWDKTADILSESPVEEAVWQLVEKQHLEFTLRAPVLFKMTKPKKGRENG